MDNVTKEKFIKLWHFNGAELPIVFFYTDNEKAAFFAKSRRFNRQFHVLPAMFKI